WSAFPTRPATLTKCSPGWSTGSTRRPTASWSMWNVSSGEGWAMGRIRRQRVAEAIRQELGHMLQRELKDPRIGLASIVQVEVSQDFRHAKVYVSVYGSAEEQEQAMRALQGA